ncbi:putative membrane protein [hydrothermal vent metagenome]|uniref:Putative membrane protein n=1 Tax=hydrothermal vent metagenome TaxID=652676 RepID=A0A3B1AD57_9ZZZZ
MFEHLTLLQIFLTGLIFIWTGFVRSGLGFGGAALGLPLMFFIDERALYWLPMIGVHLLFFTSLTLRTRLQDVDWHYLGKSLIYLLPPLMIGVFGLLNLPNKWLVTFVYLITFIYAVTWLMNWVIQSNNSWLDRFLLISGGYVAGTSLTGAPLIVAVFMRHVDSHQLRNTLFVLWFIIVSIKMTTFVALGIELHFYTALIMIPVAAIGHYLGLKAHDKILQNDQLFKRVIGGILIGISLLGLYQI